MINNPAGLPELGRDPLVVKAAAILHDIYAV